MSSTIAGALLALGAALALNGSYLIQHAGSSQAPAVDVRRPIASLAWLLRSPVWSLGALLGLTGWALHIAAMREAPLSLVQAFVAGGLALAAPMAAAGLHRRLEPGETHAIGLMTLALLLLAFGLPGGARHAHAGPAGLGAWVAASVALAAALALRARGPSRPLALAVAGGLLYGAADLSIKDLTGLHGLAGIVASPWLPAAAVTTVGAFYAFQRGLQSDRPLAVIALMTAATNVSSIAGAFAVFGDPLGHTPVLQAAHALAFVLVVAAAWRLAPAADRLLRTA
jgi:hypothetical protein